jgi:hypothetical protein
MINVWKKSSHFMYDFSIYVVYKTDDDDDDDDDDDYFACHN